MNPLQKKQIKTLNKQGNADLARKVDEIVRYINKLECDDAMKEVRKSYRFKFWSFIFRIRLKLADRFYLIADWLAKN